MKQLLLRCRNWMTGTIDLDKDPPHHDLLNAWIAVAAAVVAALSWTEDEREPPGWMRHPKSGRRRPGGDPEKEYIRE